jgi:hypothetical protein
MVQLEHIPDCFKRGVICPIPKGGGKDSSKKENNRPITLLPCLYKVFEKVLLHRFDDWLSQNKKICELQGAGMSGCSSVDTVGLLQETVAHHTQTGNTVYVVLLDVAKAFDSVWIEGLLYKLFDMGIEGRFWRLLRLCYDDFKCSVLINNVKSEMFNVYRGVHQGAPLSMRLYQVFNNDLVTKLSTMHVSVGILDLRSGVPTFADDIALIALFKVCMNILLGTAFSHSRTWRYDFHANKSLGLRFGKDMAESQSLVLGDVVIAVKSGETHMGVPVSCTNVKEQIVKRCEKVKREVKAMMSMGNARFPLPPTVGSRIYRAVCLPKLLYGLEVCPLDKTCMSELDKTQRYCAKIIQGLPMQTPNPVPEATLGWPSVSCVIDFAKIMFLYRWLSMPTSSIYKRVAILKIVSHIYGNPNQCFSGPLLEGYRLFLQYGLEQHVSNILDHGVTLSIKEMKRVAWKVVYQGELNRWRAKIMLYGSLTIFKSCIVNPELCVWWNLCHIRPHLTKAARSVVRLTCGQHCIRLGQRNNNSLLCKQCDLYEVENVSHLLFECTRFNDVRTSAWDDVINEMPLPLITHMNQMGIRKRTEFLFSGFNCNFTPEWLDLYEAAALYIHKLYRLRVLM